MSDKRFLASGVDEGLKGVGEVDISHAVEGKERVELHSILYLSLLRVLLWDDLIGDITAEVTVIAEHALGHRGTEGRIDLTHQHGGLAERLRHPLGELGVLLRILVIDPEMPRPGYGVITAAEEGAVGDGGEGGLQLLLRGLEVGAETVFALVDVGNLLQTREELLVLRDVLRHRTRRENHGGQYVQNAISFHGQWSLESLLRSSRGASSDCRGAWMAWCQAGASAWAVAPSARNGRCPRSC